MSSSETCIWTGATGSKYTYYVYERHPSFNAGQDGNYVYAKKNGEGNGSPFISARVTCLKERQPTTTGSLA